MWRGILGFTHSAMHYCRLPFACTGNLFPLVWALIWGRKHKTTYPLLPGFEGESGGGLTCGEEKGPEYLI